MITTEIQISVSNRMLAAALRDTGMQLTPLAYIAYHGLGYTVKHRNQDRNFTMAELEAIGTYMHEHDIIVADMESERIDRETATEKFAALRARNLTAFMAE
jgi:hypothetical protein